MASPLLRLTLAVLLALGLAACGKRPSRLEPPPGAASGAYPLPYPPGPEPVATP